MWVVHTGFQIFIDHLYDCTKNESSIDRFLQKKKESVKLDANVFFYGASQQQ